MTQIDCNREAFKDDQYILVTQVKQVFYLEDKTKPHWKVVEHVNHKKFYDGGVIVVEDDPDIIHFDNSSNLPLSTSLNDLNNATLHIDGQSTVVDAPPYIIDVPDEDDDIIGDEDALPYDLSDSNVEDLINVDDDEMSSADVTRSHGGDGGGDDCPPSHVVPTGCGGCFANKGKNLLSLGIRPHRLPSDVILIILCIGDIERGYFFKRRKVVIRICLFMHDPREPHQTALKRILRYVRGTLDYGLQLFSASPLSLIGYSDADWVVQRPSIVVLLMLLPNWKLHVAAGHVRVLHVPSRYQFADIFTKRLPYALFDDFRSSLSVRLSPAPTAESCQLYVLIWLIISSLSGSTMANTKNVLWFIIIFQYLPRLYLIFPLTSQIVEATGVVTETAWAGAAYNLMLFMLASHVMGASWYLLSIERQEACWRTFCLMEDKNCEDKFFDCESFNETNRNTWFKTSNVSTQCVPTSGFYQFGIYGEAVTSQVTSALFFNKYFYCLWFGLKNLSSLGQNFSTSTYVGEIIFAIIIATVGLVLFALLIGNMQTYLQSTTVRLEEWRIRRTDTEQWMRHRQLPQDLKQSVRRYDQYKWVATRGVDEESLLKDLPLDLRRDIKRHLCYDLVRRVPLFDQMDERMLDAICERLKPSLCTQGTCLVREGDPVNEMLFIIRGNLDSYTTNGGRTGFFNSCRIGPGDFCGEELLTWALDPRPSVVIPSSTRTVKAISEVEAFALIAEDLKFVASQYRRLHSKQLRHKFRFYSHQWRTWAACFVQAAWRRYKRRQSASELRALESFASVDYEPEASPPTRVGLVAGPEQPGFGVHSASKRRAGNLHSGSKSSNVSSLQKPTEPDFSVEEE
ncbi:CNGC15b-like protein [Tanacetum coccineum]